MCVDYRDDELNEENISEESTPLQDEETLTEPTDVTFDTRGVESDVVASRQVINLILNKKVVLIMGLGIFAFFFLLLFAFLVNNSSDGDDYIYKEASCKNVKVIYDPYGDASGSTTSMPIEDYVRVATYAYTSDFPDTYKSLLHVYYAVAVALRTEALSHNCEITYRDKDLKNIQNNIKENDVIEYALKKASGVVLVDENEDFVKMQVADFCWTGDNSSHYSFPKVAKPFEASLSFVKDKIKSFVLSDCECNKSSGVIEISEDEVDEDKCFTYWSEEETVTDALGNQTVDVTWYKEYLHQDVEDAFQVYGAYYEFLEQGFNFEHIFSFFLKEKAYFRTIDEKRANNSSSGTLSKSCQDNGEVPYNASSLTKTEFVSKVTEFFASGNYASYADLFVQHAGEVYDMGVQKNINPELIYIFARKETAFTSRNNGDTDHYNYYGLGHGNTASHGTYYSSFMEGVEALYDYFVSKGSLEGFRDYSYIGDYWYNPGDSSLGGCYYYKEFVKDFGLSDSYIEEACSASHIGCSKSNHANCVETRTIDQDYYFKWQKLQYAKHRKAIFGLDSVNCYSGSTEANGNVPPNMLHEKLDTFLLSHNSSISDINSSILTNVKSAGVGTRAGVVTAATSLINYMADYGVRIPYTYSGGHYSNIQGPRRATTTYYGVDPDWGTPIGKYYYGSYGPYTHYGPDCSAFVSWALHNGGIKFSVSDSASMRTLGKTYSNDGSYIGQPGDPLVSPGHVQLILSVNEANGTYMTAESGGNRTQYAPDAKGIGYETVKIGDTKYTIVDFSNYYDDASRRYSESEFESAFEAGMIS